METGLYIHVPICISRCRYCDFYKLTPSEWDDITLFIRCLEIELQRLPQGFMPDSVFIGGGTPTALDPDNLSALFDAVSRSVDLSRVTEFSSEANPGTITKEKLTVMREGGVNRISMGAQSFNPKALRLLGRIHKADQTEEAFHMFREAGFDNLNIDLIQSIPGMTQEAILEDVSRAVRLKPEHISYYNLIYEPGTPMTLDRDAGRLIPPGDEQEADNYYAVREELDRCGYRHYEISNFCRSGRECRQNLIYWMGGEYFGCGPSAHSHWNGARFGNVADLQGYCDRLLNNDRPFDEVERLGAEEKARETLVMWLRLTGGLDPVEFKDRTGVELMELCGADIGRLVELGLLEWSSDRLALAEDSLFVSNSVFSELI